MRTRKGRNVKYTLYKKQNMKIDYEPNAYPESSPFAQLISEANRIKHQFELIASAIGRRC